LAENWQEDGVGKSDPVEFSVESLQWSRLACLKIIHADTHSVLLCDWPDHPELLQVRPVLVEELGTELL